MGRGKSRRSLELIDACTEILEEIQPATVRAVCYRLFTMGLIDSMAKSETNKVGRQLVDAREAGQIPWAWIVDETRGVEALPTWADPEKFADTVTRAYRRDKWAAQPVRIEVWSEKGTVRGTLAPVLNTYEVPFRVMHGFASATTVQEIAHASLTTEQPLVALYVGDWDPSGLYMTQEDLPGRVFNYRLKLVPQIGLSMAWCDEHFDETEPKTLRVALSAEDVADPELPSFPLETKSADPRHGWYREEGYGTRCWELDALSPVVLRERVEAAIVANLDLAAWDRYVAAEAAERQSITRAVRAWGQLAAAPEGA